MKSAAAVQFVINVCLCGAVNVAKIIDVNNLAALYRSSGAQQVTSGSIQRYQIHQDAHIPSPTVPWINGSEGDANEDFDCTLEVDILQYAWSNQKKLWCCRRYLVGCSPTGESVTMNANATNNTPCKTNITKVFAVDVNGANSWPVPNEWACGLICQGRAADGCCSFEGPAADVSSPYRNAKGVCYWLPASAGSIRLTKEAKGWRSSRCLAGFGTAKCVGWQEGLCVANLEQDKLKKSHTLASIGLPMWKLDWEEEFDSNSCVQDDIGIWRPNPQWWSYEYGYKRGNELQWYGSDNVECKDGKLVITAKRERVGVETPSNWPKDALCKVKGWNNIDQRITNLSCSVCSPPTHPIQYGNPCDVLQQDGSGEPVCDCSQSAEYSSSSLITKGKKTFGYGLYEIKAKIDTRTGSWPSWWFVGNTANVTWPRTGQIDILDAHRRTVKSDIIHANESATGETKTMWGAARTTSPEWEAQWHVWQMEWDSTRIAIRIDNTEVFSVDLSAADPVKTGTANPFTNDKRFFMILNLAVSGNAGGSADKSPFPICYEIDYIKAYTKRGITWR